LPQVKCPQCGAVNDTRAPGYPFCVGCRDNLAKCGYCRWFVKKRAACTHPVVAGVFEVSEAATPPCVYHAPAQDVLAGRPGVRSLVWVLVAAAVVALSYGVVRRMWPAPPVRVAPTLELAVESDYGGAVVGETYTVMAIVYNVSSVIAENVRLDVAEESLLHFYLDEVRPEPISRGAAGKWRSLSYSFLSPHERRRIALELVPRKKGTWHIKVRLVSDDNIFHGVADLPVKVIEKPADVERGDGPQEGSR